MITQREIDLLHVSAQDYLEQVRAEFQQALTGRRVNYGERQRATNSGAEAQSVPAAAAGQPALRPASSGGDDTGAGGDPSLYPG